MRFAPHWLFFPLLILPLGTAMAAGTNFGMQGGGTVSVDPDTNRATITRDGVTTPLWDGTHRMSDGSVLIIRQGEVVPNQPILEAREPPKPEEEEVAGVPIVGYSPCEKLVRQVCGRDDQCAGVEGCNLARQLLGMEKEERTASDSPNLTTYTSGKCRRVASDPGIFPECRQDRH
jgi:hypothetical protein